MHWTHRLAQVRDADGFTPDDVFKFLYKLLKQNDNTGNPYSDYSYVATLIEALGALIVPHPPMIMDCQCTHSLAGSTQPRNEGDWESILKQAHRFLKLERLLPSYHNRVTVACLKVVKRLQLNRKIPLDLDFFKTYTTYGHYRKVAIPCMRPLCSLSESNDVRYV